MQQKIRELLAKHNPREAQIKDGYWHCPECGYDYGVFPPEAVQDPEDEFWHLGELLAELVTEYQARAWDKGLGQGSMVYSGIKRIWTPRPPTNANRNPYRYQQARKP